MPTLAWVALSSVLTAAVCLLVVMMTRARRTPYMKLVPDEYPGIEDALPLLSGLTASSVYKGNRATVLQNGAAYDAMLEDIAAARHTVHLETFVWAAGRVETQFVDALCAKARDGVKVRVLIDSLGGAKASAAALERLTAAGVQLASYCKPRWWNWRRFNHRTHRKLLIVDGRIGYTFGHGVADEWLGDGDAPDHWRDTAVRLEGPVAHGLQAVFAENWLEETKTLPAGEGCFPALEPCGDVAAHVVSSASGDAVSAVATLYTVAIACARREVLIQNPYFAPGDGVVELFAMMVRRGVRVHLMVPGRHTDSPFVRRAGRRLYEPLLAAGVRIYEFEPTLLHQKIVVVDGVWSHIGSTNFDARSLALNEEVGVGLLDRGVAAELEAAFARDLRRCHEVALETWRRRPLGDRLYERFAYLLHEQL
ncbi:MAG TPA: phospholipase D-like domain-containing protein [Gammaproteobacteria bacterium]